MDWLRDPITRFEPTDIPQVQMLGFMQSMLAEEILKSPMVKSTAISDAGLTKQTLYEVELRKFQSRHLRPRDRVHGCGQLRNPGLNSSVLGGWLLMLTAVKRCQISSALFKRLRWSGSGEVWPLKNPFREPPRNDSGVRDSGPALDYAP